MIKGILFDYGGTIDTNGIHWAEVLWENYQKYGLPVTRPQFLEAYKFGERSLALRPVVQPTDTFLDVLLYKLDIQFDQLISIGIELDRSYVRQIAADCHLFVQMTVRSAKLVLNELVLKYPLVMVSNFYGNLNTVLEEFGLEGYFQAVVESVVVGVRKPDPAIYRLGVTQLGFKPEECLVIGDSYSKDIVPATTVGCKSLWLLVKEFQEDSDGPVPELSDTIRINDFSEIPDALLNWHHAVSSYEL